MDITVKKPVFFSWMIQIKNPFLRSSECQDPSCTDSCPPAIPDETIDRAKAEMHQKVLLQCGLGIH